MSNIGTRISTLWIVVMFTMTPALLLVFAILLEIPVVMIYLSRVLKPTANRWANTVAVAVTVVYVIGGGSFNLPHYIFFAAVEIGCMAYIVWSVWARRSAEAIAPQPAS
jgi:hypothetical protein